MMGSATYHLQGSCSAFPSLPSSWSRGSNLKHFVSTYHPVGRKDGFISLKCTQCSRVGASLVLGPKSKLFKISAFKGSGRQDDSGGRTNGSNSLKNPVKVSYLQHESEESSVESANAVPYTSEDETGTRKRAIQDLFKHWLFLLRTSPQTHQVDEVLEEPSSTETSEVPNTVENQEKRVTLRVILKSVWCYFQSWDAAYKIPLLIFTPMFVAVNLVYGSAVSEELLPLWFLGPLAFSVYIMAFQAIWNLYIFSFKQSVKVVKDLPVYYSLIWDYIFHGKLKEAAWKHIWKPVEDFKNMDYRIVARRRLKILQGWLVEKYLDFVESIWPHYCRTIRFLKRANLI